MSTTGIDTFLMGGGGKSANLKEVGNRVTGTILDAQMRQQTEFGTNTPKTWDDGTPAMQLVVTLQTDQRDDPDDDGIRNVYIKGGFKSATTQRAVAEAVKAAGESRLEIGGTLALACTGEGEPSRPGFKPPKLYAAKYTPPPRGIDVTDPFAD